MDTPVCPICGKEPAPFRAARSGDPAFVCLSDDAAHRAAAAARKLEREALLRAAKQPTAGPTAAALDAIAAWERPDPSKVSP